MFSKTILLLHTRLLILRAIRRRLYTEPELNTWDFSEVKEGECNEVEG